MPGYKIGMQGDGQGSGLKPVRPDHFERACEILGLKQGKVESISFNIGYPGYFVATPRIVLNNAETDEVLGLIER